MILAAPFAVIAAASILNTSFLGISTEQWSGESGSGWFTFHWFGYVWDLYRESLGFSIKLALLSVAGGLLIGVPGGYALAASRHWSLRFIEALVMLPLALPGIALSVGLIQAYSFVRGSWWLILAGHVLYTLPFIVRLVTSSLRSIRLDELEMCARGLGAGPWKRFAWIILPTLRHEMILGSLLIFAVSWGEFNVSFLLNTPLHQTYPAALYATYTSNSVQVAGAATVLFLAVLLPALWIIQSYGVSRECSVEQGA